MASPLVIAVQPRATSDKNNIKNIARVGNAFIKATNASEAIDFINANSTFFDIYVDTTDIGADNAVEILNAGASKIFLNTKQLISLTEENEIPSSRLVAYVASDEDSTELRNWLANAPGSQDVGVCSTSNAAELFEKFDFPKDGGQVFKLFGENVTESAVIEEVAHGVVAIVPSNQLSIIPTADGKVAASNVLASRAVPDRNTGLIATLVVDERGVSLGFVWSNKESLLEALKTGTGVYHSRKRGLWYKGQTSGDTQELLSIGFDCDADCLVFRVKQLGRGFCHLGTNTCFGRYHGLSSLQKTLQSRKESAPPGSYTARLFNDPKLVEAKIMEEAEELCQATTKSEIASEAADLIYFALTRCIAADVSLEDIEKNLDLKNLKVKRRKGDAKARWAQKVGLAKSGKASEPSPAPVEEEAPKSDRIEMKRIHTANTPISVIKDALERPSQKSNEAIVELVKPIIADVRANGDAAVLKYTHKFEKATSLTSPVLKAPFPQHLMQLSSDTIKAIDVSFENIKKFHSAQKDDKPLVVETMPGVVCSRFSRPIERVGLYIPGGTAVLPSTALMLGVPAMVAGCKRIVFASPPRSDGSISPEIVYAAHKCGAESIVLAGGAQAVAAMAYGTESITKVDKILGPGNQFVTAAKMMVSNDTSAGVSIDMPAGPSEVLVIADKKASPAFVASDLLSQAEHGVDSQVILIAVDLDDRELAAIDEQVHQQANALPRVDIVRGSIAHSVTFVVKSIEEAMNLSNEYAPEHLILQLENAEEVVPLVQNAGSVFIGQWTPESVGDYSAGVNHSLPTYGYAKQYSGVNLGSFVKHITSSNLSAEGLRNVSEAVMQLAAVEGLDAHKRAVSIRMDIINKS
ncbi:phosphoribosyl-AMP cyclohydrolase, putative [Talaromyces stipitatus ATCC 10500]|uniref:Histidine biosynthesis trifunctional protein n=1 Tax=Talaromyces stipitatus (strain ATCC 10500 / CBS 375.48 / QM 6759 / NRRL 1006) TaxID=441959 RepID=B8M2Z5_TALSN|nr:phosphoribosyl-AMP cyclohydrolase, putative [Talaromyces stipitatus ATCC 10500]EED22250.1 phosphoribosyl-AMP cyclohydrolase, putative [Talaromyces stipitatus ATCC 10500]